MCVSVASACGRGCFISQNIILIFFLLLYRIPTAPPAYWIDLARFVPAFTMAKKSGRSRKFNLKGVRTRSTLNLSTLASFDLLSGTLLSAGDNEYRLISTHLVWSLDGLTAEEGPILVGIAHGDYTDAEIEEAIEASLSINKADKIAAEQANRLVRIVGVLSDEITVLNDGKPVKTKLNWGMPEGVTMKFFGYNEGGELLTTGASINCAGTSWIRYT